jgi:nitrogen fixation protein FixH
VQYELPAGVPHYAGMPRPVDVRVADRDGRPVSGLSGQLFAIRPSDARLNQSGPLTEIPQQAGCYRTLVRMDQPGAWEVRIDARQQALRFVHAAGLNVPAEPAVPEGTSR